MRIKRKPAEKARIELVPMIDTMAFLLVFFMIASLAMSRQAGLPVSLPKADSASPQTWGDRALVVTLDQKGQLFLNKDQMSQESLEEAVRERLAKRPDLMVVINADTTLRHGRVIAAIDAVKRAGAEHMAIATRPKQEAPKETP